MTVSPDEALISLARMLDGRNLDPLHTLETLDANRLHERMNCAKVSRGIWAARAERATSDGAHTEARKYTEYWALFHALYARILLCEGVLRNPEPPLPRDGLGDYTAIMNWIRSL
jgi:hypothetical protein